MLRSERLRSAIHNSMGLSQLFDKEDDDRNLQNDTLKKKKRIQLPNGIIFSTHCELAPVLI